MTTPSNGKDTLSVVPFDGEPAEWDAIVSELEGSTFCHLAGWRPVMESLGHPVWWFIAVGEEDTVQGALPLVRVKSVLFGDYLISMPFLSYGGPIGSDAARAALASHAVEHASALGVDLMELRVREALPTDLRFSDRKITVLKSLPESVDELWENELKAKVRSQVRRPMKEGLECRIAPDLLDPFYDVFAVTMRDLGTPVLPKIFFEAIRHHLGDHVVFAVVEGDEQPLAAGCGFLWQGEFEITWAGALREYSRVAPNMLLYWALMEESVHRGADTFNFGRCTPGSGTHRFKKQWGTEDQALPWAQWSRGSVAATPNPDSAKYRLATRMWQRLPVQVANTIGPMLARSLP
ncbi:MAG: FemAB family XrtA/PEP-CTERM system-associated protein [Actinomycetota bacterium]